MSKKRWVSLLALILLVLAIKFSTYAQGQSQQNSAQSAQKMKDVSFICIGFIDGNIDKVAHFKTELTMSLSKQGFTVSDRHCDAMLIGSLGAVETTNGILPGRYTTIAAADMKLLGKDYAVLWKGFFQPRLGSNKGKNDGIISRSVDIANSLGYAKKTANRLIT